MYENKVYDHYARTKFEKYQDTDADYLIIGRHSDPLNGYKGFDKIPHEGYWETIDEAIRWFFNNDWGIVEIFDLYSPFEDSLIKQVSRVDYLTEEATISKY